jgi:hypothetical protein
MKLIYICIALLLCFGATNGLYFFLEKKYCFLKDLMKEQHVLMTYTVEKPIPFKEIQLVVLFL